MNTETINIEDDEEESDSSQFKVSFAREAAILSLEKLLLTKTYGERITAAEIQESTGFAEWRSFRKKIRQWAFNNNFVAEAVKNDGYRLAMPAEHVDSAERNRKKAMKLEGQGLHMVVSAIPKLEKPEDVRRAEFFAKKAVVRLTAARKDHVETRKQFKLGGDRVPLRKLTK